MSCERWRAAAGINIALIKYWGKRSESENLPAVGSLSLTLSPLGTETFVRWGESSAHMVSLNGVPMRDPKIEAQLDWLQSRSGRRDFAHVESINSVPTAAGLASSASGMAALSAAAWRAAGLPWDPDKLSSEFFDLVRRGSGSAPRSLFGGWVELERESGHPRQLLSEDAWSLSLIVCQVSRGPKAVSSREGMRRSAETSPFYPAWVERHHEDLSAAKEAVARRSLSELGPLMEHSTFKMHACMWASRPPLRYLRAESIALLDVIEELRGEGFNAWATMDAGPHVKVLCPKGEATQLSDRLRASGHCLSLQILHPGPGLQLSPAPERESDGSLQSPEKREERR